MVTSFIIHYIRDPKKADKKTNKVADQRECEGVRIADAF